MADARANILITAEDRTKAAFDSVAKSFEVLKRIAETVLVSEFVKKVVEAGQLAEQSANRLTAAYRLQGEQVGITRKQLDDLADSMAAATQFNDNDFKRGEAELLKFGNIYGDVFTRAVKLSADLAAFNGGDLVSAFGAVGKALANPIDGMKGLGAATGKLLPAQTEHIKNLLEQNRGMAAQNYVLDLLQHKIGGTAELMNSGYTKATEDYAKAWDKVKESLAGVTVVKGAVVGTLEGIATALGLVSGVLQGSPEPLFGKRIAMYKEMLQIQEQLAAAEKAGGHSDLTYVDEYGRVLGEDLRADELKKKLAALRKEYDDMFVLPPPSAQEQPKFGYTKEQQSFLDELDRRQKAAELGSGGALDQEFARADQLHLLDVARPKILAIATATNEATASAQAAAKAWADWNRATQFVEDLKDSTKGLEASTHTAKIAFLPVEFQKWGELSRQQIEAERQALTMSDALAADFLDRVRKEQVAWNRAWNENYAVIRSFGYGFRTTMGEIYDSATNSAAQTHDLFIDAFRGMEDALVGFVKTGKLNFHDLADSIITDLIRIQIQRAILGPLAGALGGAFGSWFSGGAAPGTGATSYGPTARAGGGEATANQPYWVGERGPELFVPRASGTVVPNGKAGGPTFNVDMRGASLDAVMELRRFVQSINGSIEGRAVSAVTTARQRGAAGLR